jgi:hypothetical protein
MADRIVTAAEVDRTPTWDKWRLIDNLQPWQCAALWANIDPDKLRPHPDGWMVSRPLFCESQSFNDRLDLVLAHQYGALRAKRGSGDIDRHLFAAWVREKGAGWDAPVELLAMANRTDGAHSGKRTDAATKAGRAEPFEAQYWNLMQVLAWVFLRDRSLVRDAGLPSEELAKERYFFGEHTTPNGRLELIKTPVRFTVTTLRVEHAARGSACYPALHLAEGAIIEALRSGRLTAYGLQNGKGDLKEIPALSWADLKFWYEPDFAGPKDVFRYGATHWHNLTFQRKDVLAIWQLDDRLSAEEQSAGTTAAPPTNIFRTMTGLKWEEVSITFTEWQAVRIKARGESKTFTYEVMGFKNQQSLMAKPNKVWDTLRTLAIVASTSKTLKDEVPPRTDFRRRVSRLRDALQVFFGIEDDPIRYAGGEYDPAFILIAEEHVAREAHDQLVSDAEDEEDIAEFMSRPPGR